MRLTLLSLLCLLSLTATSFGQYAPTYSMTLGSLAPADTAGLSFERTDPAGTTITTSQIQTWTGGSFNTGALAPGDVIGFVTISSYTEDDLVASLVIDSADSVAATASAVVDEVSVALLQQITLAGGTDPTGSSVGTVTLTNGTTNELSFDGPQLFTAGSAPTFPFEWLLYVEITSPVLELPFGPSDIVVATALMSDAGDTADVQETFVVGAASPDYYPEIATTPSVLPESSVTPLTQTITDPAMSRVTIEHLSTFEAGSWDLSTFTVGANCGSGQVDFFYDDTYVFDLTVSSVVANTMTANVIVTSVAPDWLTQLIDLGESDPTGTSILTIEYSNTPGGGCTVSFDDHNFFPYGVPPQIGSALVVELNHAVTFLAPSTAGPLAVNSVLQSSLGDSASLGETLTIGAPIDQFDRGDCNGDGGFDISDAVFILESLFVPGGQEPECRDACDSNDDGGLDIGDAVYKLTALFGGGTAPPAPHGSCGTDPTSDTLECATFTACP